MAFKNFKVETDADGIVLVTWDIPGRSMNVLDETSVDRTRGDREADLRRCCGEGRRHHLGQGSAVRRRRSVDAGRHEPAVRRDVEKQRRGCREPVAVRPEPPVLAGVSQHRDLGQAMGRRDQRAGTGRRLRTDVGLPLPRRRGKSQDPARAARNQGRAVPRRRRHPARAAHRAAAGCDAAVAEGRGGQSREGQGAETDRRHRSVSRSHQVGKGLDQGRRQGRRALGREGFQASGRPGLFQGRHDDVPGRQRDLSPRDLRQLSGGARDHELRLRRLAVADRCRLARRIALLHAGPAQQRSGRDDPQPVPVDAGIEQGRAASAERAADQGQEACRDRRRLHGRQRRLRLGTRRHRSGA